MLIYPPETNKELNSDLLMTLKDLRKKRGFDVEFCMKAKSTLLNDYLRAFSLESCIVAISGGIDSAVVLGLVSEAAKESDSPIKKIIPVILPIFSEEAATNQEAAVKRAKELCSQLKLEPLILDLTQSHQTLKKEVDSVSKIAGKGWAAGQLVSYIRTPTLYYLTSLLTQEGMPGLICGTTNRDEGAYLGYFGKSSDGMVDLQLISDLHKYEVYQLAKAMNLPKSIQAAVPTGDMYDGRTDEDVFGAPYDFVELFILYFSIENSREREKIMEHWSEEAKGQFNMLKKNLEAVHHYNRHKYFGGSPAVHLNVYEAGFSGGWPSKNFSIPSPTAEQRSKFVNDFEFNSTLINDLSKSKAPKIKLEKKEKITILKSLLSKTETENLVNELNYQEWLPVGINGIKKDFKTGKDEIGSYRSTTYNQEFANVLWERIQGAFPMIFLEEGVWRAISVSPLMRFIKYKQSGKLIPHYDSPFIYDADHKTLMTLVIYLSENYEGGRTRFLKDPQAEIFREERDYSDWKFLAKKEDIAFSIEPQIGSALIFDHRTLHDSETLYSGEKILLRTDIIFQKCDPKIS